jgi:hypothetical protein
MDLEIIPAVLLIIGINISPILFWYIGNRFSIKLMKLLSMPSAIGLFLFWIGQWFLAKREYVSQGYDDGSSSMAFFCLMISLPILIFQLVYLILKYKRMPNKPHR